MNVVPCFQMPFLFLLPSPNLIFVVCFNHHLKPFYSHFFISHFLFSGHGMSSNDFSLFSDAIKVNSSLTSLSLWGFQFPDTDWDPFFDALHQNSSLTSLNLNGALKTPQQLSSFASCFDSNITIVSFESSDQFDEEEESFFG